MIAYSKFFHSGGADEEKVLGILILVWGGRG